jgi:hypothetical protein
MPLEDGILLGMSKFNRSRPIMKPLRAIQPGVQNLAISGR